MANAWDETDDTLIEQLQAWLDFIAGLPDWHANLYKNDYTPVPGSVIGDYVPCDFPGYLEQDFSPADFGPAAVAAHVASSSLTTPLDFDRDGTPGSDQTAYGYYITDDTNTYRWGERFTTPRVVNGVDKITLTPRMQHKVAPS